MLLRGLPVRVLRPLVRGDHLRPAVAVEVAGEHPDVGAAVLGHRRDHPRPVAAAQGRGRLLGGRAGVLEVDEMGQLAGGDDVEIAVAVEVRDRHVLGRRGFVALGEGGQAPGGRIGAAEGEPDVALADVAVLGVRLVNRDDVEVAVAVEVGHLEPVAAADRHAADRHVVDDVLAPGDPPAVGGLGAGGRVGDEGRGGGLGGGRVGRLAGRQCDDERACAKERGRPLGAPAPPPAAAEGGQEACEAAGLAPFCRCGKDGARPAALRGFLRAPPLRAVARKPARAPTHPVCGVVDVAVHPVYGAVDVAVQPVCGVVDVAVHLVYGVWRDAHGWYQIGDDQARSWIVGGKPGLGSTPARIASQVDQRQVGFSSTRR